MGYLKGLNKAGQEMKKDPKTIGRKAIDDVVRVAEMKLRKEFEGKLKEQEGRYTGIVDNVLSAMKKYQKNVEDTKQFLVDKINELEAASAQDGVKRAASWRCAIDNGNYTVEQFNKHYEDVLEGIMHETFRCLEMRKDSTDPTQLLRCNLVVGHEKECAFIPWMHKKPPLSATASKEDIGASSPDPPIEGMVLQCSCGNYVPLKNFPEKMSCSQCERVLTMKEGMPVWMSKETASKLEMVEGKRIKFLCLCGAQITAPVDTEKLECEFCKKTLVLKDGKPVYEQVETDIKVDNVSMVKDPLPGQEIEIVRDGSDKKDTSINNALGQNDKERKQIREENMLIPCKDFIIGGRCATTGKPCVLCGEYEKASFLNGPIKIVWWDLQRENKRKEEEHETKE